MHTVFYEIFFISDKQLFYVMKFLNALTLYIEIAAADFFKKVEET